MTRIVTRLCSAIALFAILAAVPSAAPAADTYRRPIDRLIPMLQQLGYHYHVLAADAVVVDVPLPGGGVCPVILMNLRGSDDEGYDFAMVPVAHYAGAVPTRVAARIQQVNGQLSSGRVGVVQHSDGSTTVVFVAMPLPADADATMLGAYLRTMASTGRGIHDTLAATPTA